MAKNMGTVDKSIRVVLAVAMVVLAVAVKLPVALRIILPLIALIFIVTSLFSRCPLYVPLKINTRKRA